MYHGILAGGVVVLTDPEHGLPVVDCDVPEPPEGYVNRLGWRDTGLAIERTCTLVPVEGTAAEAALALSRMQYQSLPDSAAYELRALAPDYVRGETYPAGTRFRCSGRLFRADEDFVAPEGLAPSDDEVPCTEQLDPASAGPWEEPADKHTYRKGSLVTHEGRVWRSRKNNNVEEPGTGDRWEEVS